MTNDSVNNGSMTNEATTSSGLTWDEATFTWDSATGTWENPYAITNNSVNNGTITNEAVA